LPSVRGDLLKKLGRFDEARAEFERAAALTRNARSASCCWIAPERAQAAPRHRRATLTKARVSRFARLAGEPIAVHGALETIHWS